MSHAFRPLIWTVLLLTAASAMGVALRVRAEVPPAFTRAVVERIEGIYFVLEEDGDYDLARAELTELFDQVIAYAPANQAEAFLRSAAALRLVTTLSAPDPFMRADLLPYLRANPELADAIAFLIRPEQEKPAEVYALLDRFRVERGETANDYPTLTAAICVVHDRPLARRINENTARAADPLEIFDFFVKHEEKMFFGVKKVPAELLIYVVDTTATISDMQWALSRYGGDPEVGQRFFDIEYDVEHYRTGAPKKVTVAGWDLPNILQYGGVCADQAYFATEVGKSIGVPTTYAVGRDADVSHAWVGFLQAQGRDAWWNFDTGRYPAYKGLKGIVADPQTRRGVPDSYVSLLAEFALSKTGARHAAAAYTDAAARLATLEGEGADAWPPPPLVVSSSGRAPRPLREPSVEDRLSLIEQGLRQSAGYSPAWFAVRELAAAGELTLKDKKRWAELLDRLCGMRYPDFSMAILGPMVQSVQEVREQDKLWNAAFNAFKGRHDLAAEIRMAQGAMWAEAGDTNKAGQCYEDVIQRYANAGPFVLQALSGAERLLKESDRSDEVLLLYRNTWARIDQPEQMAGQFARQSNWYRVGVRYAARLEAAGFAQEAAAVRSSIGAR